MTFLEFLIKLFWLISIDTFISFVLYTAYKYIDYKYFSSLEITTLKEENKYLRTENQKLNGTSTTFWNSGDKL